MARTIGIDLGTTNSCMAVLDGTEPSVVCLLYTSDAADE